MVDEYNKSLERLREKRKLPTPQEIIDSSRDKEKIDLISMIEELNKEDAVLLSAIEGTEEITRTGVLEEQMGNFRQLTKERDEKPKGVEIE